MIYSERPCTTVYAEDEVYLYTDEENITDHYVFSFSCFTMLYFFMIMTPAPPIII